MHIPYTTNIGGGMYGGCGCLVVAGHPFYYDFVENDGRRTVK